MKTLNYRFALLIILLVALVNCEKQFPVEKTGPYYPGWHYWLPPAKPAFAGFAKIHRQQSRNDSLGG
jgi:hypothetical protein